MANKKTNYNKMSEKSVKEEAVVETVETTEEVISEPEVIIGVVTNCEKLNVRANPDIKSEIVCTINKGDEVIIDKMGTTKDFYCVHSIAEKTKGVGFHAYCMKDFITIE